MAFHIGDIFKKLLECIEYAGTGILAKVPDCYKIKNLVQRF
jgi:predicted secreted Zn-dependent protease